MGPPRLSSLLPLLARRELDHSSCPPRSPRPRSPRPPRSPRRSLLLRSPRRLLRSPQLRSPRLPRSPLLRSPRPPRSLLLKSLQLRSPPRRLPPRRSKSFKMNHFSLGLYKGHLHPLNLSIFRILDLFISYVLYLT